MHCQSMLCVMMKSYNKHCFQQCFVLLFWRLWISSTPLKKNDIHSSTLLLFPREILKGLDSQQAAGERNDQTEELHHTDVYKTLNEPSGDKRHSHYYAELHVDLFSLTFTLMMSNSGGFGDARKSLRFEKW